jgi:hypothetical protein
VSFGIFDNDLWQPTFLEMAKGVPTGINQRSIVLNQSLKSFPCKVEAIKIGIFPFQLGDDAKRLCVVIEAAKGGHELVELTLTGMAKRRVAEIMGQGQGFGEIFIETQRACSGPPNLGNFDGMGKPGPVVIALVINENLGLVLQAPKGGGMNDAVPVTLERGPWRALGFSKQPSPALLRFGRIACRVTFHFPAPLTIQRPRPT